MVREWIGFLRMVVLCWMDLVGDMAPWTKTRNKWYYFDHRRRQHQCTQPQTGLAEETTQTISSNMASSYCKISPIIPIFVSFLLVASSVCSVHSSETDRPANQTFRPGEELEKLKIIRDHLLKINKPAVKTIQVLSLLYNDAFPFLQAFCFIFLCFCFGFFPLFVNVSFSFYCLESWWWSDWLCSISSATSFWSSTIKRTETIGNSVFLPDQFWFFSFSLGFGILILELYMGIRAASVHFCLDCRIHRRDRKAITQQVQYQKIFSYGVFLVSRVQKGQFQSEEQLKKMF